MGQLEAATKGCGTLAALTDHEHAVHDVLCRAFDQVADLRAFLERHAGRGLALGLPQEVSLDACATAAALALGRRGAIDAALFQALADAVPEQYVAVRQAAVTCGQEPPTEPRRGASHRPAGRGDEAGFGEVIPTGLPAMRVSRGRSTRRPEDWLEAGSLPLPRRDNPASLLHARRGVVPFHAWLRAAEVASLRSWWRRDDPVAVAVVVGPGGVGKTRLMLELCAEARADGIVAGFVGPRATFEDFEGLFAADARTLAIVDYAETRPAIGRWLAHAAGLPAHREQRTRIVLVARALGEWWDALLWGSSAELDALLRADDPVVLDPDALDGEARARIHAEAAAHFARRRGRPAPDGPAPDLASPQFGRVLYLHMAALASVEGRSTSPRSLLSDTLRHERQYWSQDLLVADPASGHAARRFHHDIDRAVMAVALAGGADTDARLDVLLARAGVEPGVRDALKERLVDLYPGTGDADISPLAPDLLAEAHVAEVMLDRATPPELLPALFAADPPEAIRAALTLLGRIVGDPREVAADEAERLDRCLRAAIDAMLAADLEGRAPIAVEVAAGLAARRIRCPFADVLAAALRREGTPALAERLARDPVSLAVGVRPVSEWVLRTAADAGEPATRFTALIRLAALELGQERRDAAHVTMGRVAAVAQAWMEQESDALWATAVGVGMLGLAESEVGEVESGLARVRDGLAAFSAIADVMSADLHEPLRLVLGTGHGLALLRCGAASPAIATLEEVVAGYAALAATSPDVARAERALADLCLGQALGSGGRLTEAAAVLRRAVSAQRDLVAQDRGSRLAELAWSLTCLCDAEKRLGAVAAALAAGDEATRLFEELGEADAGAAARGLGMACVALAGAQLTAADAAGARAAAARGVELLRPLAGRNARVHAGPLAVGLCALGLASARCDERAAGLAALAEAEALLRPLAASLPDVYVPVLGRCLMIQGFAHYDHDREASIACLRAALEVFHALPEEVAAGVLIEWGLSAVLLGAQCPEPEATGEVVEALSATIAAMESVPDAGNPTRQLVHGLALLTRALRHHELGDAAAALGGLTACVAPLRAARAVHAAAGTSLATALRLLARAARDSGDVAEAEAVLGEAVEVWRETPAGSQSHADDLADDLLLLARIRREHGRVDAARPLLAEAERVLRDLPNAERDALRGTLVACLTARAEIEPDPERRLAGVQEALALAVADLEAAADEVDERLERVAELAILLVRAGRLDEAVQTLEQAVARARRMLKPDDDELRDSITEVLGLLSELHEDHGEPVAGLPMLRMAADLWRPRAAQRRDRFAETLEDLAEALEEHGRTGEARVVRIELRGLRGGRRGRHRRKRR